MAHDELMRRYRDPQFRGISRDFEQAGSPLAKESVGIATKDNPFCGDTITIALRIEGLKVATLVEGHWEGYGCSLCIAAAETLLEQVIGRPVAELEAATSEQLIEGLGGIAVSRTRMKCVDLPLACAKEALQQCSKC